LDLVDDKILKKRMIDVSSMEVEDIKISTLDKHNQSLRAVFVEVQEILEGLGNITALKESWVILREMHGHRKISPLLSVLQNKT
jgi:hypothetical protein